MNDSLFDEVASVLSGASNEKPWMTANYIAGKIASRVDGQQIEETLLAHCRDTENRGEVPIVRYSSLPSRTTLEVLWGAIEKVGPRKLASIIQDNVADDSLAEFECLDQADVFLSHCHRDYAGVMAVARHLLQNDIVPWLAETHIEQDKHIHEEIISALGTSQGFLLYLSPNALDSRWTGKEYHYALNGGIPIYIVADITFRDIRDLLNAMGRHDRTQFDATRMFNSASSEFTSHLIKDHNRIVETFAYSQALGVEVVHSFARPLVELPDCIRERRNRHTS
jgi:hypothetical protein